MSDFKISRFTSTPPAICEHAPLSVLFVRYTFWSAVSRRCRTLCCCSMYLIITNRACVYRGDPLSSCCARTTRLTSKCSVSSSVLQMGHRTLPPQNTPAAWA